MTISNAVKQYTEMKISQICAEFKNKELPNWVQFEDYRGWSFRVNEGDLNIQITTMIYDMPEVGPGNFLIKLATAIMTTPIIRNGYEIMAVPIKILEFDFQLVAEDEVELQNGLLQLINDEAGNILCQLLDNA